MAESAIAVRSYRRVHKVERRIYRVDKFVVPVPGGIPLRAAAYFAATVLAVLFLSRLPLLGLVIGALSPPVAYFVVPLAVAVFGVRVEPDGRAAHRFAGSWVAFHLRAHRRAGGRVVPVPGARGAWEGEVSFTPGPDWPVLLASRVVGPGVAHFRDPVHVTGRHGGARVARPAMGGHGVRAVTLGVGERLEVRP